MVDRVRASHVIGADAALLAEIRDNLRAAGDAERAPQMQSYMKSAMPYLGVPVPATRRIARAAERGRPPADRAALVANVRALWRDAEFREERYAATALLDTATARRLRDLNLLPLYEELIVEGAWWDHVDELAHRVGELLIAHRADVTPVLRRWAVADDLWLRRCAIISQFGAKTDTDTGLLTYAIEANLAAREFFVRKAIGWALREYARTDPDWVRRFVDTHELSGLSRREATKHLY